MAISFNTRFNLIGSLWKYDYSSDVSTGVYDITTGVSGSFKLFENDATVGDYLVFNMQMPSNGIHFNIMSGVNAATWNLLWEYRAISGWGPLQNVVDNTNKLRNAGTNTVTWTVPNDWCADSAPSTAPVFYYLCGFPVRARITTVTGLNNGGFHGNVPPSGKSYAIELTGNNTYYPADIYNASVANGWNISQKLSNHYRLTSNLIIGDNISNTKLIVCSGTILEIGGEDVFSRILLTTINSTLQGGFDLGGPNYIDGGIIKSWIHTISESYTKLKGNIKLYNSIWWTYNNGFSSYFGCNLDIVNSILSSYRQMYIADDSTGRIINSSMQNGTEGNMTALYLYAPLEIDRLNLSYTEGLSVGTPITITNVDFGTERVFRVVNSDTIITAKNCTFGSPEYQVLVMGSNSQARIVYTLVLDVRDEIGVPLNEFYVRIVNGGNQEVYNDIWGGNLDIKVFEVSDLGSTNYSTITLSIWKEGYESIHKVFQLNNTTRFQLIKLRNSVSYARDAMGPEFR